MNKRAVLESALILFVLFCVIYFAKLTLFSLDYSQISLRYLFYNIGRFFGLVGFLFLSILIISGDTARFFDRFFGMDRIIKFQRKFALLTVLIVIFHPVFFILSNGDIFDYLIPNFASLPLALGIISFYLILIYEACSILYKRISYQAWQYIHMLEYVLFFFALYHILNLGSDAEDIFVRSLFIVLSIGVVVGFIYRTYYKMKHRKFKFYVKEVKWETPNVFTLKLKSNKKINFKPGQFCFLMINKDKLYARHPFTISSSPYDDTLDFTIKVKGRFTQIASQLKEGEEVTVDGPFGTFTVEDTKRDLVFIAGGVGITPFMSIIRSRLNSESQQNITLLYASRTEKDIIFKEELESIKEGWFKKVFVLSREPNEKYEYGHIDERIIRKYVKDINNSIFYICGPEPMKKEIVYILKKLGVKDENIRIESFFW